MIPPFVLRFLITHDTAGVERIPSLPTISFDTYVDKIAPIITSQLILIFVLAKCSYVIMLENL